jgi:hypothetical protein
MDKRLLEHPVGHETRDAGIRPIVLTGVGIALSTILIGFLVYGIFSYLANHPAANIQANPMSVYDPQIPPQPRLEDHPAIEIQQLHSQEDQMLSTYGWVDKKAGVVRIPIERAMELQLQRGFPTRKEAAKK